MQRHRFRWAQDEAVRKPDLRLNVPEALKTMLVDDWEAVTKNHQVRHCLPKIVTGDIWSPFQSRTTFVTVPAARYFTTRT